MSEVVFLLSKKEILLFMFQENVKIKSLSSGFIDKYNPYFYQKKFTI